MEQMLIAESKLHPEMWDGAGRRSRGQLRRMLPRSDAHVHGCAPGEQANLLVHVHVCTCFSPSCIVQRQTHAQSGKNRGHDNPSWHASSNRVEGEGGEPMTNCGRDICWARAGQEDFVLRNLWIWSLRALSLKCLCIAPCHINTMGSHSLLSPRPSDSSFNHRPRPLSPILFCPLANLPG